MHHGMHLVRGTVSFDPIRVGASPDLEQASSFVHMAAEVSTNLLSCPEISVRQQAEVRTAKILVRTANILDCYRSNGHISCLKICLKPMHVRSVLACSNVLHSDSSRIHKMEYSRGIGDLRRVVSQSCQHHAASVSCLQSRLVTMAKTSGHQIRADICNPSKPASLNACC